MKEAQTDLADEVTPQISELLKRAEQSLAKLERKQFSLKSKVHHPPYPLSLNIPLDELLMIGRLTGCEVGPETDEAETG